MPSRPTLQSSSGMASRVPVNQPRAMDRNSKNEQNGLSFVDCVGQNCHDFGNSDVTTASWLSLPAAGIVMTEENEPTFAVSDGYDDGNNFSELFDPSSYQRGFNASANAGIILCSVGIFANLLLFGVLCSRRLRVQHLYNQVLNIALADLCYIVSVDSFTVYFELQSWRLGSAFCKAWMILDVVLPSVSTIGLLLLNLDRIIFAYKISLYQILMQRKLFRMAVILCPWCCSCVVVNTLWLGFPAEAQQIPGACVYGITQEANTASIWLTVFIPSLIIFIMIIFIFIAGIGEMPSVVDTAPPTQSSNTESHSLPNEDVVKVCDNQQKSTTPRERQVSELSAPTFTISHAGQHRFVAALLAVDVFSLAITLPYSAYSQVNISCRTPQTCQSFVVLFQILSWMKSSVTCVRPVFFLLLTDAYLILKKRLLALSKPCGNNALMTLNAKEQNTRHNDTLIMLESPEQNKLASKSYENILMTQVSIRCLYIKNLCPTTTVTTITAKTSQSGKSIVSLDQLHTNETADVQATQDKHNGTFV